MQSIFWSKSMFKFTGLFLQSWRTLLKEKGRRVDLPNGEKKQQPAWKQTFHSARKNTADFGTYFQKWDILSTWVCEWDSQKNSTREDYFLANSALSIHPLCLIIDSFVQNAEFRFCSFTRGLVCGPRQVLIIKGRNVGERVAGFWSVNSACRWLTLEGSFFFLRSKAAFQRATFI